jgi:hypothetical protein
MGGAGYLFTGDNDAGVMHNSAMINLYMAGFGVAVICPKKKIYTKSYEQLEGVDIYRYSLFTKPIRRCWATLWSLCTAG